MNILITGGAGFIGSHVCEIFLNLGHKVVCVDNFDEFYPKNIKKENIKDIKEHPKFHLITEDVRDTDSLIDILTSKKIELVIHLAGKAGAVNSLKNPLDYISYNVNGTVSVLEAMKEAEVEKIIFASSSAVYGLDNTAPYHEEMHLGLPTTPYAASKQSAENFLKMYHKFYDTSVVILRLFSVYGPRQRPDSGMAQFMNANLKNQNMAIYGEGKILRDYAYITDVANSFVLAKQFLEKQENTCFEIFNIANGNPVDINTLFNKLEAATHTKTPLSYKKSPTGILSATYAGLQKAEKILGYKPKVTVDEGIALTLEWMK